MNFIKCTVWGILLLFYTLSCKKGNSNNSGMASINIIQATINVPSIVVNFVDTAISYYENQNWIAFGSSQEYGLTAGKNPITIVSSNDTLQTLWQGSFNLKAGGIYSFYLSGTITSNSFEPDTLFLQDAIPTYSDSVAGVRFINLSSGSNSITVNLQGNSATQTEFPALKYRQISSFKPYPDTNGISIYTFEVRDGSTDSLLAVFSWNFTVFKNNTLVICGSENTSLAAPINVFQVNNF